MQETRLDPYTFKSKLYALKSHGFSIRDLGNDKFSSFTLFDAMLSYQADSWRFAVNVRNLADKYYIASCTYGCFYGEGRKIIASASYNF